MTKIEIATNIISKIVVKALLKIGLSASNPIGAILAKILTKILVGAAEDLVFELDSYKKYRDELKEGKEDEGNLQQAQTDADIIDAINNSR